ncbi:MAG: selenocysteine-specific translation elongation factor [Deltaproteobacteria bacterium]|nr:selenocysteine-specific translation elongation factor [Candidatus Anaeroferrophillus wilburensis]MBN2888066.1 selenocysteine-specific translation elongation factor [Deltaproteobacteria bacterium]
MHHKRVILGTAGHVDHGKTTLVKVLTGTDTDRLLEEKKRGITIELGFAHLDLPDGQSLGIVDVPGHERFIKNMVAGVGGIDLVALLIAADEGVMPQTREHLDICRLLGVEKGLVVLSKTDLVDDEWRELVIDDVRKVVAGTFLAEAPILPVSATTGAGIEALLRELMKLAAETVDRPVGGPFRLPVDRAFVMKGFGTVVTGTTLSGTVTVGDQVVLLPGGLTSKVRGVQTYGSSRETAAAGERTAINLQGLEKSLIVRGEVLAHPHTLQPTSMIDIYYHHLPGASVPLKPRSKMMVHCGTAAIMATVVVLSGKVINPGESGFVQVRLDFPTVVLYGDRLVLRSFAWQETMGGGRVLNPRPQKHRLKEYEQLSPTLEQLRQGQMPQVIAILIDDAGIKGLAMVELAGRVNLSHKQLKTLLDEMSSTGEVVRYDVDRQAYISGRWFVQLKEKLENLVAAYHQQHPVKPGILKEELKSRMQLGQSLFTSIMQRSIKEQRLVLEQEIIRMPDHQVRLAADEQRLKEQLRQAFQQAGLQFPDFRELCAQFGASEAEMKTMVRMLEKEGELIRVREGCYISRNHFEQLKSTVVRYFEQERELTTLQFKEMVGLTRKYIIPLIECLDVSKVTRREGDVRVLWK